MTSMSTRIARFRAQPGVGRDLRVLAALLVVGAAVSSFILVKQRVHLPWEHRYTFAGDFASVTAVSPGHGQEVRIAGVPVGSITGASLNKDGRARLTMQLEPGHPVYRNATLVLRPKSPLNEMYVEMDPGTKAAGTLHDGGVIPLGHTAQPVQQDEVLSHLDQRTRDALSALLAEADVALANPTDLTTGVRATQRTATDLAPISAALTTRRAKIAQLVTSLSALSQAVGGNDTRLSRLAADVSTSLNVVAKNNDSLSASLAALPGVVQELGTATKKVSTLTTQLKPTLDNVSAASSTLPTALTQLTATMDSLRQLAAVAAPVVASARPVVAGLRPVVRDLSTTLRELHPVTGKLDQDTALILPYLGSIKDFFYNTASLTSLSDANGGIFRGLLQAGTSELPIPVPASTSKGASK